MARYERFKQFYPYYLSEHRNPICRRLHVVGSSLSLLLLTLGALRMDARYLIWALLAGYGFAWIGHFFFEKNRPATFSYPFYSFMGDWVMFADVLRGRISLRD